MIPTPTRSLSKKRSRCSTRKLRELCRVETEPLAFEQFVYQPVEAGSYFAIYVQPGRGFIPKPISPEEFAEIRRTEFIEPLAEIL